MNIDPNHGGSRKERQINAITRTAVVAAHATLGLALTAGATELPSTSTIGYRGDGSGVFPASNPRMDCDMKTGRNILWTAPLPNSAHGSPIVVKAPSSAGRTPSGMATVTAQFNG